MWHIATHGRGDLARYLLAFVYLGGQQGVLGGPRCSPSQFDGVVVVDGDCDCRARRREERHCVGVARRQVAKVILLLLLLLVNSATR